MTRSRTATERLQSANYRTAQPATPVNVPDNTDIPGFRDGNSDEDLPGLIDNTGDSDDDDFLPTTRRRPPTVP